MIKKYPVKILEELYYDGTVFTDDDSLNYALECVYTIDSNECKEMVFKDVEENKFFHVYCSEDERCKSVRFICDENDCVNCFEVTPKTKTIVVFEEVE